MKALKYGAVLLGIYLGVVYFEGASKDLGAAGTGISRIISAFQGRAMTTSTPVQT